MKPREKRKRVSVRSRSWISAESKRPPKLSVDINASAGTRADLASSPPSPVDVCANDPHKLLFLSTQGNLRRSRKEAKPLLPLLYVAPGSVVGMSLFIAEDLLERVSEMRESEREEQ